MKNRYRALRGALAAAAVLLAIFAGCLSFHVSASGGTIKRLKIKNAPEQMAVGDKVRLRVSVSPSSESGRKFKWTSSDKDVATVSSKGVVKAKAVGTVKITVKAQDGSGKKARVTIEVVEETETSSETAKETESDTETGSETESENQSLEMECDAVL